MFTRNRDAVKIILHACILSGVPSLAVDPLCAVLCSLQVLLRRRSLTCQHLTGVFTHAIAAKLVKPCLQLMLVMTSQLSMVMDSHDDVTFDLPC